MTGNESLRLLQRHFGQPSELNVTRTFLVSVSSASAIFPQKSNHDVFAKCKTSLWDHLISLQLS